jgi:D-amino-acid dehydrogenase
MRIVVVGAGVVGLACVYELLQDGHDVVILDSSTAGQAASHGNAAKIAIAESGPVPAPGMVVQGLKWMLRPDSPLYVKPSMSPPFVRFMLQMARNCTVEQFRAGLNVNLRLAERANEMFDEWRSAGLDFEMHERGVLIAYESPESFESRLRYQDVFDRYGAEVEVLDQARVHEVEPALSDRIHCGLFYPQDRQIEPDSLTLALVQHIRKLGGVVLENSAVEEFQGAPGNVTSVRTGDGHVHPCDGVVLAAGVWTTPLAARLGAILPVQPGKGYSVDYAPSPVTLRTSLTLDTPHIAITPLGGMVRVAGTMEFSGFDASVNTRRVAAIKQAAADGLRDWDPDAPHRTAWAGLRPMTPDGLPVVGRLTDAGNTWVATGHGMLGLTLAPTTARTIREQVRGARDPDPATSPGRFQRKRLSRVSSRGSTRHHRQD